MAGKTQVRKSTGPSEFFGFIFITLGNYGAKISKSIYVAKGKRIKQDYTHWIIFFLGGAM